MHQIRHVVPCFPASTATATAAAFLSAVGAVLWFQREFSQRTHGEDVADAAASAAFAIADAPRSRSRRGSGIGVVVGACDGRFRHGAVVGIEIVDDGTKVRDSGGY